MRALEQQVEVGQQGVNVSDGCSPVVEGGELGQDVLRRQTYGKSQTADGQLIACHTEIPQRHREAETPSVTPVEPEPGSGLQMHLLGCGFALDVSRTGS